MTYLTSNQLKQYNEEGYIAPINVLSIDEANEVRKEIEFIENKWPNELYGSGRNWGVIAKRLSDQFFVITVDLRNHGDRPWLDTHNYHVMADRLISVINSLKLKHNFIGH